ncbi:MAG: hypothetical protein ABI960_11565, partial [Candidatus Eisenbacteria bacterium]
MIRKLFATPIAAAVAAVFVGAAAAHDVAIRPRFDLLALYAAYVIAVVTLEMRIAHAPSVGTGRWATAGLAAIALMAGSALVTVLGWPALWIVLALALMAFAFVTGPRLSDTGLAGPVTIAVLGPLASSGAALAVAGHVSPTAFWIGVPVGLLADAARRAREAAASVALAARAPHLSTEGSPPAPPWFAADLISAFGGILVLVSLGTLPWPALLALATLPWALGEAARARTGAYAWGEA